MNELEEILKFHKDSISRAFGIPEEVFQDIENQRSSVLLYDCWYIEENGEKINLSVSGLHEWQIEVKK